MTRLLAALVLSAVCFAQQSQMIVQSKLASTLPLARLSANAAAIVVGTFHDGVQSGSTVIGRLRVRRTLKGPIIVDEELFVRAEAPGIGLRHSTPISGLWFLSGDRSSWTLLPVMNTSEDDFDDMYIRVPVDAPQAPFIVPDAASASEKVTAELASALMAAPPVPQLGMQMLTLAEDMSGSPVIESIFRVFADSSDSRWRWLGISGFIDSGDLNLDREAVSRLAASQDLRNQEPGFPSIGLCNSRVRDPDSIRLLGTIVLPASLPATSKCAAVVLRLVHIRAALPYLAALLNHPTQDMRYEGVMGLASFANNLPIHNPKTSTQTGDYLVPLPGPAPFSTPETREHFPAFRIFQQDETPYLTFWKSWWQAHRSELTAQ